MPLSPSVRTSLGPGGLTLAALLWLAPAGFGQATAPAPRSTTPTLGEPLGSSDGRQIDLAEHLHRSGALFYGAWWCPACFRQKHLFGREAGNRLPYVECDKSDEGREHCRSVGIRAYPTWILGEKRLEGVQTIEQLIEWSGYRPTPGP